MRLFRTDALHKRPLGAHLHDAPRDKWVLVGGINFHQRNHLRMVEDQRVDDGLSERAGAHGVDDVPKSKGRLHPRAVCQSRKRQQLLVGGVARAERNAAIGG